MLRTALLRGEIFILALIETTYVAPRLHVYFSKKERSPILNGIFTTGFLRGMLNEKSYHSLHICFLFVAEFMDQSTCFEKKCPLKTINTMNSYLLHSLYRSSKQEEFSDAENKILEKTIQDRNSCTVKIFGPHCYLGLLSQIKSSGRRCTLFTTILKYKFRRCFISQTFSF